LKGTQKFIYLMLDFMLSILASSGMTKAREKLVLGWHGADGGAAWHRWSSSSEAKLYALPLAGP